MIRFFKYIFYISLLFLIIISIYPGSLIGYLLYGDFGLQPNLIENAFGTAINHFIYYFYLSFLGIFIYFKTSNYKKIILGLFFLAIILEFIHFVIPNRSFQISDLVANIFGVMFPYFVVKIYLLIQKP